MSVLSCCHTGNVRATVVGVTATNCTMDNQIDATVEPLIDALKDKQSFITSDIFIDKWGFDLENLYKIALKFYKG